MATQEMILKLSFDDEGTFTGLEDINQELAKTDAATKAVEKSTKTLKAQYAELKKQQDQMDPGTEKFAKLSVEMGQLKDRMNDAAEAVKGNTGPAIEGARASFGMMGEQMANLDFEGLSQSLNLVSGNLARLKPEDISAGLKSMGTAGVNAFKALGKAIMANPILLVAGILIAIAMNFDKLIKLFPSLENALTGIDEQQRNIAKNAQATADASKKAYDNSSLIENSLRLQGKSEKEILQIKMKKLETSIQDAKVNLDIQEKQAESQIAASRRNAELLKDIIKGALEMSALSLRLLVAPIDLVLATANRVSEALGFGSITALNLNDEISKLTEAGAAMAASLFIDPAEQEAELKASFEKQREGIAQMTSDYQSMQLSIKKIDDDAAKEKADKAADAKKTADELAEDARKKAETDAAARAEFQKVAREEYLMEEERLAEEAYQATLSAQQKEIDSVRNKYFELINLAEEGSAQQLLFIEAQKKAEAEINNKYEAEAQALRDKEADDKRKKKDDEIKLALQAANDKLEIAQQGMTALSALGDAYFSTQLANVQAGSKAELDLKKKQFAFNKKMQIGGAIMDTAKAITAAIAANPFPSPTLPISIALASITGAAQIAKIASTKFDGGSGTPAPPSIPTGGGNAPAIDFSGANMQVNAPGGLETYVLAGNVANALEARQKIIDQSHL
jgi:hypothetical protein